MPSSTEQQAQDVLRKFRDIVGDAVSFVRSQEITKSFVSLSLEELIDQQIALINEPDASGSPSKLARLDRLHQDLLDNIEAMKNTSPDLFRARDNTTDVNTDQTPPEDT